MQNEYLQILTDLPWMTLGLLLICGYCLIKIHSLSSRTQILTKLFEQSKNELRAINSGHLGMGRQVRDVSQFLSKFNSQQIKPDACDQKTYQQASMLLSRGASIDEVVDSFQIAPAEAELLSIICNKQVTSPASKEASLDSEVA